jgi:antitoxin HicB
MARIRMSDTLDYTVILEPQTDGGYTVSVPALPEVVTEGETEEEALQMAKEAIRLVLDYRRDNGLPLPADTPPTVRKVTVPA